MRLDPNDPPETVVFNGTTYRLMGGKRRYYLSQSRSNEGRRRAKGLHVAIWEDTNGPVPRGHEVHHRNGDTFDCRADNLECLPIGVHRRMPKRFDREKNRADLEKARILASRWHGSPEGRAWHREHTAPGLVAAREAMRAIDALPPALPCCCVWCGVEFLARRKKRKYCTTKCQWQCYGFEFKRHKFEHPHHAAARLQPQC